MKKLLALLALSLFLCSKGFAVDSLSDGKKEANKKARKAVADFFISTFEITPL